MVQGISRLSPQWRVSPWGVCVRIAIFDRSEHLPSGRTRQKYVVVLFVGFGPLVLRDSSSRKSMYSLKWENINS